MVLLKLVLVVVCLDIASEAQTDKRSILFVGSKDAVSISAILLLWVHLVCLCWHLHSVICDSVPSLEFSLACLLKAHKLLFLLISLKFRVI